MRLPANVREQAIEDFFRPPARAIAAGHWGGQPAEHMGRFELDVCVSCFGVDWHGVELATMRESPQLGVSRIERGAGGDSEPFR